HACGMPLSVGRLYVFIAAPVCLLICSTRAFPVPLSGNQPHSSALPLPVSSGQPCTVPTLVAFIVPVSTVASVDCGTVGPTPPATNSLSVVPPIVSVEKPMPICMRPSGRFQLVGVQLSVVTST